MSEQIKGPSVEWVSIESYTKQLERADQAEQRAAALRQRVWALRPALQSALRVMQAVEPQYRDYHEGAEIARSIGIAEQALEATAGPSLAASGGAAPAEQADPIAQCGGVNDGRPCHYPCQGTPIICTNHERHQPPAGQEGRA